MNVIIQTLGCRLNQIESESIAKFFSDNKFDVSLIPITASSKINSDVVVCVVNTCSVTQKSEQKARRLIRLLLEKFPSACVMITGCYAELSKNSLLEMSERVAVLPGKKKSRMKAAADFLQAEFFEKKIGIPQEKFFAKEFAHKIQSQIFDAPQENPNLAEATFSLATENFLAHSRASIKIQDGCNCNCSYCAIKNARGKSVSLDATDVIERVVSLEKSGQAEVVFTGVNVAQYTSTYGGKKIDFADLILILLEKTQKICFRVSSIWPTFVTDKFCHAISNDRVMPHFHLSVQSGSDRILSAMHRSYTARDVLDAVNKIRAVKKEPFLACDIIAGFPGETEEDFSDTVALMRDCNFSSIHAFPFSARPNTDAFEMKPKVPQNISSGRVEKLIEIAKENKLAYINSFSGKTVNAVAESFHGQKNVLFMKNNFADSASTSFANQKIIHAVTENFLHCKIICKDKIPSHGEKITVKIISPISDCIANGTEYDVSAEFIR